jgi:soluble lytic murein transglycosylase-like protein
MESWCAMLHTIFSLKIWMRYIVYFLLLAAVPAMARQATGGSQPVVVNKLSPAIFWKGGNEGNADFLAAHDAFLAGDIPKLRRYAQRFKKTPLEVYVSYYQLSLFIANADPTHMGPVETAVRQFLARPEDTPMIDKLREEWLKFLGKNQQWNMFDAEYPRLLDEDTELKCYALQSRRRHEEKASLLEARKLWFTGKGLPDNCGLLFEAALSGGIISEADVERRLRLALEANNVSLAIKLVEHVDKYAGLGGMLKRAAADPERYLNKFKLDSSSNASDIILATVNSNIAIEIAASAVEQSNPSTAFPEALSPAASGALAPPVAGPSGWEKFWSQLGFNKNGRSSTNIVDGKLSPSSSQTDLSESAVLPASATSAIINEPAVPQNLNLANDKNRIVALFALLRLAKQSPDLAVARWTKIAAYFPVVDQQYFYSWLGYEAARNQDSRALQWYRAAGETMLDEHRAAWRARAALRAQDWPEVSISINAMNEKLQHEVTWQYWKARALQALGKPIEAREIFAPLSAGFNFYGQLAIEELGDSPVLSQTSEVYKPDKNALAEMLSYPGIQRTLALYRMGLRSEAQGEWGWVLRNFNDRELLTAAEIARRNEMYDRAIGAADKTISMHDFSLRFLAPYRAELQAHIQEQSLDEAWVFGLMRQESRFALSAKSDTGASGLMQIMPSTARWVAQKLGLKSYRNALIHQLDTNLRLGTYYMKTVLALSDNNPVLASAAYNAGPNRALQWRGERPLEGAIYVETIPFEETRDYVKKVMSNTVYYADQFGNPTRSLKQRMGIIAAKPINKPPIKNLPGVNSFLMPDAK